MTLGRCAIKASSLRRWSIACALVGALGALGVPSTAAQAAGPAVPKAIKGERCVEDNAVMRRQHMSFLKHQRDATVHQGIRGAKHSLKGCIECHASATTGSVAAAPADFCRSCHAYAAVKIDCFECHASRPGKASVVAGGAR